MTIRGLTSGERELARSIYRNAIDLDRVEIRRRRWWPLQPRNVVMAPRGHVHFHPHDTNWSEDFSREHGGLQGLFLHELCHVWQHQQGVFLPIARHPFCRYHYSFVPGWPLKRYGIEQQAEIVRHAFLLRQGATVIGAPPLSQYESLLAVFR
ncbi:vgr related protein [Sphingomonas jeddahensis]|uniref:Vgr related protein n=1 Tax=Sphingomonas jeddahensis TaxID=1915074 RepID=A0A1V2EX62_9SPHN|nr:vgr related protein [Sphingomonas jeddahensis]ONF97065.1 hypothetical protein SPHI_05010 [Sphingomonas jeddahensis]